MTIEEHVEKYLSDGWAVVPVRPRDKAAAADDFNERTFSAADFGIVANIAVKCGAPSSNRIDVDIDSPEALIAADLLLPVTPCVHGRPGKPRSHRWYVAGEIASEAFRDPTDDGGTIIEIRSTRNYTLVPPSVHPSGDLLAWESTGAPLPIEVDTLRAAVTHVAIAALAAAHWPRGKRHAAALALAGFLKRRGIVPLLIPRIVEATATAAHDEEIRDRVEAARATATRVDDRATTGGVALRDLLGDQVVRTIGRWLAPKGDDPRIEITNERFFMIDVGTDPVVGEETTVTDGGGRRWTEFAFRSHEDFRKKLLKEPDVIVGHNSRNTPRMERFADHWLRHPRGRQYERLVYAPPGARMQAGPNDLNGWKDFTVVPTLGTWRLTRDFIETVICDGRAEHAAWLLNWCAALFQKPGLHGESAPVLLGAQGTGKSFFAETVLGACFDGRHFVTVTNPKRVIGDFNDTLSGRCLLFFDEAGLRTKAEADQIKTVITGHTLSINRKNIAVASEPSMIHAILASNNSVPIVLDGDDRRYAFLHVSDRRRNDVGYFRELTAELDAGGRAAMLHDLLNMAVDWDANRRPPDSAAKQIAKREGWSAARYFFYHLLRQHPGDRWGNTREGFRRVRKTEIETDYRRYLQEAQVRREVRDARYELAEEIKMLSPLDFNFNRVVKENGTSSRDFWTLPRWADLTSAFKRVGGEDLAELEEVQKVLGFPKSKVYVLVCESGDVRIPTDSEMQMTREQQR